MALGAGPRPGVVYIVETPVPDAHAVMDLARRGFDIARVHERSVEIYAVPEELDLLRDLGFSWRVTGRDGDAAKALGEYNNYASVTAMLEDCAAAYPHITHLESIGQSVQGRELWVLYISDNPGEKEDEPAFKYIATMHGDEPVGTELCLYFIDLLLTEYGSDPRITELIDNTAIAIMPLMNPDGREAASRYNAQYLDLNRRFPHYPADYTGTAYDGEPLHDAGRPPEVAHVMRWTAANRFVLSANFHTGALVVNYPYDEDGVRSGTEAPTPDDALFQDVSRRYSFYNLPMWNSSRFQDGITNGSAWYAIFGSMQDWNYRYIACNEVTIELSDVKRPAASTLPQFWEDNRESMLAYLEAVQIGVRGLVTDALTGDPLDARITIEGNAQPVFTDPDVGNYHRMLLPGMYTITVESDGYQPWTIPDIIVDRGTATRADVALVPLDAAFDADVDGNGVVNAIDVEVRVLELEKAAPVAPGPQSLHQLGQAQRAVADHAGRRDRAHPAGDAIENARGVGVGGGNPARRVDEAAAVVGGDPFQRVAGQALVEPALKDEAPEVAAPRRVLGRHDLSGRGLELGPGLGLRHAMLLGEVLAIDQQRGPGGMDQAVVIVAAAADPLDLVPEIVLADALDDVIEWQQHALLLQRGAGDRLAMRQLGGRTGGERGHDLAFEVAPG